MTAVAAINLRQRAAALTAYFSPRVIGEVNDVYVKVAKIKGDEIPWHNHAGEDELFYVIDGELLFEVEGLEPFTMTAGDLYIVRRGVNHRVSSTEECSILLVENKSTAHLGETESEIARSIEEQLTGYDSPHGQKTRAS
jgi:quercetin dioxygenase-like cupin family protein